ncbi:Epoxide hydrolase [Penicillium canescens]|nr:Epoxide hydrolase [Penicillium canescens]
MPILDNSHAMRDNDKIRVEGDSRVTYRTAHVNGKTYSYLLTQPRAGHIKATIFLLHGFPDIGMGWRYQILPLVELRFRVIVPDLLGFGRTDAPLDVEQYTHKNCADDMKELASQLAPSEKIIVCGHDKGARLAYRIALWYPELVSHIVTFCVPYFPPTKAYEPLEDLVKTTQPNFIYQLQFQSGEIEKRIKTSDEIRQFLIALYEGATDDGMVGFTSRGVLFENLKDLKPSNLLTPAEYDHYAEEFSRSGINGPLNWYRTRKLDYEDELAITDPIIRIPLLHIQGLKDPALPPHLGQQMGDFIPQLTIESLYTAHWILWEDPQGVNEILARWLGKSFS